MPDADGSLYLCTPLDPLFPLLPILEKARNKGAGNEGVFCALDQILTEAGAQWQGAERLAQAAVRADFACLCDCKESGGDAYYRLNDKKALAWLVCKVQQARQSLSYQLSSMEAAAQTAYVVSFLSEYLPDQWVTKLAKQLGVEAELKGSQPLPASNGPESSQHQPEKKQKVDPKEAAREAARKKAEETRQQTKAKQAVGTKKISSFFAARPKN
ncbi:ribonuclease H2, subunit B [Dunaliella salina]|uniref:Ribonuclease H2, subunit B n=1 Tax=Dunaliella salina TaxID=3046 RepID=A0ABQ7H6L8_DUNSA|nr:ribonuclease H2, subunit B [Dunaliella salina]|eukprot:KAF5842512.1 ribonuclease H2, subunit B [Dunaliella salina]